MRWDGNIDSTWREHDTVQKEIKVQDKGWLPYNDGRRAPQDFPLLPALFRKYIPGVAGTAWTNSCAGQKVAVGKK